MNRELDLISGRAVQVALEIGLFETLLEQPKSLAELAEATGCAVRGLRPLLYLLASTDLLRMNEFEEFWVAPQAPRYLALEWPQSWERLPYVAEYEQLERAVRTGQPIRNPIESGA